MDTALDIFWEFLGGVYMVLYFSVVAMAIMDLVLEKYLTFIRFKYVKEKYKDNYEFWYRSKDIKTPDDARRHVCRWIVFDTTKRFLMQEDTKEVKLQMDTPLNEVMFLNSWLEIKTIGLSFFIGFFIPFLIGGSIFELLFDRPRYRQDIRELEEWLHDKDVRIRKGQEEIRAFVEERAKKKLAQIAFQDSCKLAKTWNSTKLTTNTTFDQARLSEVL